MNKTSLSKRGPKKLRTAGLKKLQAYLKRTIKEHESRYRKLASNANRKTKSTSESKSRGGADLRNLDRGDANIETTLQTLHVPVNHKIHLIIGRVVDGSCLTTDISCAYADFIIVKYIPIPQNRMRADT